MKKWMALLLAVLMLVTCCFACDGDGDNTAAPDASPTTSVAELEPGLGNFYKNMMVLDSAAGHRIKVTFGLTVLAKEAMFTNARMSQSDMSALLAPFIVSDKQLSIPVTLEGTTAKDAGRLILTIGPETKAIKFTLVMANGDLFVNMAEAYETLAVFMGQEAEMGEWPYENDYVSLTALTDMLAQADSTEADDADTATEGLMGILDDPGMVMAVAESILASIPQEHIVQLMDLIETGLWNAKAIQLDQETLVIQIDGNNFVTVCNEIVQQLDGKLTAILEAILESLRKSDNQIVAAMIPSKEALNTQETVDALLGSIKNDQAGLQETAQAMQDAQAVIKLSFTSTREQLSFRLSANSAFAENDVQKGTMKLIFAVNIQTAKALPFKAPENVMTETELSDLIATFAPTEG